MNDWLKKLGVAYVFRRDVYVKIVFVKKESPFEKEEMTGSVV